MPTALRLDLEVRPLLYSNHKCVSHDRVGSRESPCDRGTYRLDSRQEERENWGAK